MLSKLIKEFPFVPRHIENLLALLDEGNTVPFIARYRKEQTGAMDEVAVRAVLERYEYLQNLEKRKAEVISLIDERGKLTPELKAQIISAETLSIVEDLYAPYKSKRKTKADIAREAGLEPLAEFVKSLPANRFDGAGDPALDEAAKYLCDTVPDAETALKMAMDIVTEEAGHNLDMKNRIRELFWQDAIINIEKNPEVSARTAYEDYYDYSEKVAKIPPHRVMAIFRGEREEVLKLKIELDEESCVNSVEAIFTSLGGELNPYTTKALRRALKTMLLTSVELEVRATLKDSGEVRAIQVFADNLKSLIMTPLVKGKIILGLDPAFRTGCKFAVVDETGRLLDYGVMYPTEPHNDYINSKKTMLAMVKKYHVNAVAIGNGTASRETEEFVARVIEEEGLSVEYTIVNEAGASVYSASEVAAKEFPDLDLTIRGAISIARRVIDPLAELVKIEPQSIGVGMYQHDVNKKKLETSLGAVVEDVVNSVGVNLNTASPSLLSYVAGLNNAIANKIVQFREKAGRFKRREELLTVPGVGDSVYKQCAGFLKIYDGDEELDSMFIHPESYGSVYALFSKLNLSYEQRTMLRLALKSNFSKIAAELGIGEYTLNDIIDNLEKPDRDIRNDLDPVVFKKSVVNLNNITDGMLLDGKITNIVDFGAFVDVGLKNDGLVHISEVADKFVKNIKDVVSVGQKVTVKVLTVDKERGRLSLSMRIK